MTFLIYEHDNGIETAISRLEKRSVFTADDGLTTRTNSARLARSRMTASDQQYNRADH